MTTKELINQYVTAHADNRWMDASELEALLTEFAEKLKELTSEDLEQAAIDYDSRRPALYGEDDEGDYVEYIEVRKDAFIAGAQWQREELMAKAIRGRVGFNVKSNYHSLIYGCWDMDNALKNCNDGDKVKVIIIKE